MEYNINIFQQTLQKITSEYLFNKIVHKQQQQFDIHVFQIEFSELQNIIKMYKNITTKYHITKELQVVSDSWNQNQKKLFVWFIILYTYFLQQDHRSILEQLWPKLSDIFFGKEPYFLQFQYCNLMRNKEKPVWTVEQDQILTECVQLVQMNKWNEISKKMFYISNKKYFRSPKHCRERWLNHLDNTKKHGKWTTAQDYIIFNFVQKNGKSWSKIVHLLNQSRTQHMIKNRFYSVVNKYPNKKKSTKQGQVVKNVCKTLLKIIESTTSEPKSQNNIKIDDSSLYKKFEQTPEVNEKNDIIPEVPEVSNYPFLNYNPDEYPFKLALDYNTLCYLNMCYMHSPLAQHFMEKPNPCAISPPQPYNFTECKVQQ